jgi:hypothetical protein
VANLCAGALLLTFLQQLDPRDALIKPSDLFGAKLALQSGLNHALHLKRSI